MFDVISIGAATVDIFVKSADLRESSRFLSLKRSTKNEISDSLICSGGGAINSATTFSRLGLKPAIISLIGTDPLSEYIRRDLLNETIDTEYIIGNKNDDTDYSIILVSSDGTRSILTNRGHTHLESKDIPWSKLKSRWFYISGLEGNIGLLEELIGYAKENNIKVSLNPGMRELKQRHQLIPLLKHIDFLLLNRQEAEILINTGRKDALFWDKLRKLAPIVGITNGRLGAKIITPNDSFYSPIINVHPVDETGAGDAFGSAFVAGLLYDLSIPECLAWGIRNSASEVSALGAKKGILTFKQITHATKT
ncbi:MAG: carbohydrate kinase family protein [Candidatus Shapirobacteria bacterium]